MRAKARLASVPVREIRRQFRVEIAEFGPEKRACAEHHPFRELAPAHPRNRRAPSRARASPIKRSPHPLAAPFTLRKSAQISGSTLPAFPLMRSRRCKPTAARSSLPHLMGAPEFLLLPLWLALLLAGLRPPLNRSSVFRQHFLLQKAARNSSKMRVTVNERMRGLPAVRVAWASCPCFQTSQTHGRNARATLRPHRLRPSCE